MNIPVLFALLTAICFISASGTLSDVEKANLQPEMFSIIQAHYGQARRSTYNGSFNPTSLMSLAANGNMEGLKEAMKNYKEKDFSLGNLNAIDVAMVAGKLDIARFLIMNVRERDLAIRSALIHGQLATLMNLLKRLSVEEKNDLGKILKKTTMLPFAIADKFRKAMADISHDLIASTV